ncbi:hypothetical protein [Jatrophihabitans fulvus]
MTEYPTPARGEPSEPPDETRVENRAAELLPEELAAGTDDPVDEARILLEDSDRRTEEASG